MIQVTVEQAARLAKYHRFTLWVLVLSCGTSSSKA
jgi:hypothetical protein